MTKYVVGYIVHGQVVVEADSADEAKAKLTKRLPKKFVGADKPLLTVQKLEML